MRGPSGFAGIRRSPSTTSGVLLRRHGDSCEPRSKSELGRDIAAVAERQLLTVLHYDTDFDLIGRFTGLPMEWVVPEGSVP